MNLYMSIRINKKVVFLTCLFFWNIIRWLLSGWFYCYLDIQERISFILISVSF